MKPGKRKKERFVALPYQMLKSSAFMDLSPKAVRIFIELKRRFNGANNGEISLSNREAGKIAKCSKGTAGICLKELEKHGFIRCTEKGMFTYKVASVYLLTCEANEKGVKTNDWKNWEKTEHRSCD